ncbi:MAG: ADOP family duplicated permease, partial [Acidobacteriota bacterium]
NLMLARADARRREVAIRGALGAGRLRLMRQVLVESLILSAAGGVAGLALAQAFCAGLAAWHPVNLPRLAEIGVDSSVFAFTLAISLLTGLLCGCAPALQAWRQALSQALKDGQRGSSGGARQPLRGLSVVAQVALSVILVLCAGLMLRSLWTVLGVDPGINPAQVLSWRLSLPRARYGTPEKAIRFFDQLREGLSGLPGVVGSGAVRGLPLTGSIGDWDFEIEGRPLVDGQEPQGDWQIATPGYFEVMRVRLVKGRFFEESDRADSLQVALVNQTLARRYWPDEDPLGKRIKLMAGPQDAPWATIVGVIGDIRQMGLGQPPRKEFYRPHSQFHRSTGITVRSLGIVVRAEGDLEALAGPIRQLVGEIDPSMPVARLRPMTEVLSDSVSTSRFLALMLAAFAAVALLLAAVGIYGLLSYSVSRRAREIGIRMALGADRSRVLRMVIGQGLGLALLGVALGTAGALAMTRFLQGLLYGVGPYDPFTFLAIPIVVLTLSLLASYLPSRRATRVDPMTALRVE